MAWGWCWPAPPMSVNDRSNPFSPSIFNSQLSFSCQPTIETRHSRVDRSAPAYVDDPELDSKDPETRTIARANKLVRKFRIELDTFRPALEGKTRKEIEQLASPYPRNICGLWN
jgi:hypothetical protein